jgi:hypothetical protein
MSQFEPNAILRGAQLTVVGSKPSLVHVFLLDDCKLMVDLYSTANTAQSRIIQA